MSFEFYLSMDHLLIHDQRPVLSVIMVTLEVERFSSDTFRLTLPVVKFRFLCFALPQPLDAVLQTCYALHKFCSSSVPLTISSGTLQNIKMFYHSETIFTRGHTNLAKAASNALHTARVGVSNFSHF